jgi:hypothetical protein
MPCSTRYLILELIRLIPGYMGARFVAKRIRQSRTNPCHHRTTIYTSLRRDRSGGGSLLGTSQIRIN